MDDVLPGTAAAPGCGETSEPCDNPHFAKGYCKKHYTRRYRAGEFGGAPVKQPRCCPPDHPHDYETCWVEHRCRCPQCKAAQEEHRRILSSRHGNRQLGVRDLRAARMVPMAPIKAHLVALQREGAFGLERIADAAHVTHNLILAIYFGQQGLSALGQDRDPRKQTINEDVAVRILALRPRDVDPALAAARGSERRLQSLIAIGYTPSYLADRIGVRGSDVADILLGRRKYVTANTAAAVRELFDELGMRPREGVVAQQMRDTARRHGWPGPLHLDDLGQLDEFDDVDELEELPLLERALEEQPREGRAVA